MSILSTLAHVNDDVLKQVLTVLDVGVADLKTDIDRYTDLLDPELTRPQYLPLLTNFLGLERITGLSESDARALLAVLGIAYQFKGGIHGLRIVVRALWRYATIVESYRSIYQQALDDPEGPESLDEWQTWLGANDIDVEKLLEVVIATELEADDAREYGEKQAVEYQTLLEAVRRDSSYDRLFRTYRPGFDAAIPTLLGTSQFDDTGLLDNSFLLYGRNVAFLDPSSQAILSALKWNLYPDFKEEASLAALRHFLPLGLHVTYQANGYRQNDITTILASDALLSASRSVNDMKLEWDIPAPSIIALGEHEVTQYLGNANLAAFFPQVQAAADVAVPLYEGDSDIAIPLQAVLGTGSGDTPVYTGQSAIATPMAVTDIDAAYTTLQYNLNGAVPLPWPVQITATLADRIRYVPGSYQQHYVTTGGNTSSVSGTHRTTKASQDGNTAIVWVLTIDGNNNTTPWNSNQDLTTLFEVDGDTHGDDIAVWIEFPNWSAPNAAITRNFSKSVSTQSDQGVVLASFEIENIANTNYLHELETFHSASAVTHDLDITVSENDLLLLYVAATNNINMTSGSISNANGFTILAEVYADVAAATPYTVIGIKNVNAGTHTSPEVTTNVVERRTVGIAALRSK